MTGTVNSTEIYYGDGSGLYEFGYRGGNNYNFLNSVDNQFNAVVSVNVDGNVSGKVSVQDLAVNANGKVSADVTYQSIATEKGARIDGKLKSK